LITVYGIKQCDSCQKALKWLAEHGIEHDFHDLRVQGLTAAMVSGWLDSAFSDVLINRRSTTWRTLSQDQKESEGPEKVQLLVDYPTLVKRPVFVSDRVLAVGFSPAQLLPIFKAST
jgi:arsenate reductase